MNVKYEQIISKENIGTLQNDINLTKLIELAKKEEIEDNKEVSKKILLLCIDIQNDFIEDIGSLGVQGSKEDIYRLTKWMYKNLNNIISVVCSLDTHSYLQVFHPSAWEDENGVEPAPYTIITYSDVQNEKWKVKDLDIDKVSEYLKSLEENDKKLCIWPYHCLEGSVGANLETEFLKMIYFHSIITKTKPIFIKKGNDPYSEMYGIIKPEYSIDEYINKEVLEVIEKGCKKEYDEIYIAGEASSHCVIESVKQICEYFRDRKDITNRIVILEDCMSPIGGYEEQTKKEFNKLVNIYGIKINKTN